ncbi:MAG TPA: hypothetical protein VGM63_02445 [Mucilaginibacter sp.]
MKVEDPNALRFILQDDIYLLDEDKRDDDQIPAHQPPIETPQVNFNYLGANKKNFLVLVHYPAHEYIPDDHLTALESVLTRKGYSRDDVAILNTAKTDAGYEALTAYFKPGKMVILGEASIPSGIKPPKFNQLESSNGLDVLYTYSFDAMMTSVDNKKAFWDQMKTL